jgi:hypothetical protein
LSTIAKEPMSILSLGPLPYLYKYMNFINKTAIKNPAENSQPGQVATPAILAT